MEEMCSVQCCEVLWLLWLLWLDTPSMALKQVLLVQEVPNGVLEISQFAKALIVC
jgi:hypothetical protein